MRRIENNIKFGCPEASHEQVVEAAKKARCHDFISLLPEGYNTMIGEGGSTLSGGEKQRIVLLKTHRLLSSKKRFQGWSFINGTEITRQISILTLTTQAITS